MKNDEYFGNRSPLPPLLPPCWRLSKDTSINWRRRQESHKQTQTTAGRAEHEAQATKMLMASARRLHLRLQLVFLVTAGLAGRLDPRGAVVLCYTLPCVAL